MSEQGPGLAQSILRRLFGGGKKAGRVPVAPVDNELSAAQEIVEIPHKFFVVVADDEIDIAEKTGQSLEQIFNEQAREDARVKIAQNAMDIFELALTGNAGRPADAVILDDAYIFGGESTWRPEPEDIIALANSSDINFSAFEKPVEIPPIKGSKYRPIELLCMRSNSTNFALILRSLGYQGKIFVVSSAPPRPSEIRASLDQIRGAVSSFPDRLPIDGVSYKRDNDGHGLWFANAVSADGTHWDIKQDPTIHYLSGTLGKLLESSSNP